MPYIKEYSGKLSGILRMCYRCWKRYGFCASWLALDGGDTEATSDALTTWASSITDDGIEETMDVKKGVPAVDTWLFVQKDLAGICIENPHGINGSTPGRKLCVLWGLIASPGMVKTEEIILDIMKSKLQS